MSDRIKAIQERLEKATPGPWAHEAGNDRVYSPNEDDGPVCHVSLEWDERQQQNLDLIAHAPSDLRFLLAERDRLAAEEERWRLSLAACGVAAMCNTEETRAQQRLPEDSPYWTASYGDVCRAVDREMKLRADLDLARETIVETLSSMEFHHPSMHYTLRRLREALARLGGGGK